MLLHRQVFVITVSLLLALIGCFVWITTTGGQDNIGASVADFVLGALVGGFVVLVWHIATTATGATSWAVGGRAERWTAHELDKLGASWRIFHGLLFFDGPKGREWAVDVDHVAVGPEVIIVIETKFCSWHLDLDAPKLPKRLQEDAAQAANNARRVRRLVHEIAPDVEVVPLLVYWGRNVSPPADVVRPIGKVWVMHGSSATEWCQRLPAAPILASEKVDDIVARLEAHEGSPAADVA